MPTIPNWSLGDKHLLATVPELAPLIHKYSPCTLRPEPSSRYFEILVRGMVAQQLPPEVVDNIFAHLQKLCGTITPQKLVDATDKDLLTQGLVQQKIDYLRNMAHLTLQGEITPDKFDDMTDAEINQQLMQVKGLGQWTIEMFMLLAMCRTDIIPTADHNFAKAMQVLFNLPTIPKRGQINKATETWRPWRSLAVWYLWQYSGEAKRLDKKKNKKK
ncbi:MAG: hypothetical protein PHQ45_02545 [Acidaminococcaceae bacterium]|nr:hypothetical protein [Acidaminococcaceae bacterium]